MNWQVQEAKQRFSAVLRAVHSEGPQTITRHGQDVAVVIDIEEYRRLTTPRRNLTEVLLGPPHFDSEVVSVLAGVEAGRAADLPRVIDLGGGE